MVLARKKAVVARQFISICAGVAGLTLSTLVGFTIPLGLLASAIFFFHDMACSGKDPFKMKEEELRKLIRQARELEEICEDELKKVKEIKTRVERGEVAGDIASLELRIKQLDEQCRKAREKRHAIELVLVIRENIEYFKKLFGEDNIGKLVSNADLLKKKIERELDKAGIRDEVDVEYFVNYVKSLLPTILEKPETSLEEIQVVEEKHEVKTVEHIREQHLEDLLSSGSLENWVEFLKRAIAEKQYVRIPPGRHYGKAGYKNLLKAIYLLNPGSKTVQEVLGDKVLARFAEKIAVLREGKPVEIVDVSSSDLGYIDDLLSLISDKRHERKENGTIVHVYEISIGRETFLVERRTVKDQLTGRAVKVVFKELRSLSREL